MLASFCEAKKQRYRVQMHPFLLSKQEKDVGVWSGKPQEKEFLPDELYYKPNKTRRKFYPP